jgi:hypothetical protein
MALPNSRGLFRFLPMARSAKICQHMPRLCPKIVLPDEAPPEGWTLRETIDIVCPQVTPPWYFEHLVCQAYPRPDMLAEATDWAWSGTAIFYRPLRPEMAKVLPLMMAAGGQSIIELVIQSVLTVIADLVDWGHLEFTAIHPVEHKHFRPAGGILRTPIAQPDRFANRTRREDGQVLADLRFYLTAPKRHPRRGSDRDGRSRGATGQKPALGAHEAAGQCGLRC